MIAAIFVSLGLALSAMLLNVVPYMETRLLLWMIMIGLTLITLRAFIAGIPHWFKYAAWSGIFAMITITGIFPTLGMIQQRQATEPWLYVHDGVIQTEAAVEFILNGKNPYVENYDQTAMVEWSKDFPFGLTNSAIYHLIMLPGHLLLSIPFALLSEATIGFFDARLVYIIAFLVACVIASRIGRTSGQRMLTTALVGLNPFLLYFLHEGRNDILVFVFLIAAAYLFSKKSMAWSFTMLAIACTMKLFAFVFVPFFILGAIGQADGSVIRDRIHRLARPLSLFAIITFVIFVPFIAWGPFDFYDDIIRYSNGTADISYHINGFGLSTMLLNAGIIQQRTDYYPFWPFQLVAVLAVAWLTFKPILKKPSTSKIMAAGTACLFLLLFTSRFFNDNYISLLLLLAAVTYGFAQSEHRERA